MLRHSLGGEVIFFFAAYCGFLLELSALFVSLSCLVSFCLLALLTSEGGNEGLIRLEVDKLDFLFIPCVAPSSQESSLK